MTEGSTKLGNEEGAVAVSAPKAITGIYSDLKLALPATGVYAKTSDDSINATFTELRVNVSNNTAQDLTGGTFELVMKYRTTTDDPFQSHQVTTEPSGAYAYIARYPANSGTSTLPKNSSADISFDISTSPVSVKSTDVEMFVVYKASNNQPIAVGYRNITEPTPVDVFNNTDYTCVSGQWYQSGSPELFQIQYTPGVYLYGLRDLYPHNIANIAFWVQSPDKTVFTSAPALAPNNMRRLGYILTDPTFTFGLNKDWVHTDPYDTWTNLYLPVTPHPGTGVVNTDSTYPGMYSMRGKLMWWGAGLIFDNVGYRNGWVGAVDTSCDWGLLP